MSPEWNSLEPNAGTRVRIPADVDRPDTVLAGLTARQLAILAIAAVAIWAGYVTTRAVLPLSVFAALAAPVALAAGALALGRRDGLSADRWVLAALRRNGFATAYVLEYEADENDPTPAVREAVSVVTAGLARL